MRYFASALNVIYLALGVDMESRVPNHKLTAISWYTTAHHQKEEKVNGLECRRRFSNGPHPVEWLGGPCLNMDLINQFRSVDNGKVSLFARKFDPSALPDLLKLDYYAQDGA